MDFFEAIEKRASVRSFAPCHVDGEHLMRILDAGRRAPSGRNRQPCEFIVVRDKDILARLGKIQGCIAEASVAVAVVVDESATPYWKEDAAAAIENMLLAAVALGYASLWVEGYVLKNEDYARDVLGVPEELRVLAVLPIGKPAAEPAQAEKRPLDQVCHKERYGG
ncbi:MAG: nitroreductase family protein [Candidatus Brocadiia bacterium]